MTEGKDNSAAEPVRFIILAAGRTGSNLLRDLLQCHPRCFVGSEIFNHVYYERPFIPWYGSDYWQVKADPTVLERINVDPDLIELRSTDPARFIGRLCELTGQKGFTSIGFKLMYHQAEENPSLREYLAAQNDFRIVHLKRKNLLRRHVSLRSAEATGVWEVKSGEARPIAPRLNLALSDCVADFDNLESLQAKYDQLFAHHPVLEVVYEDLAGDNQAVGSATLRFLGLDSDVSFTVRQVKGGASSLRDVIANYDELKSRILRWASFFDE